MPEDVLLVVEDSEATFLDVRDAAGALGLGTQWALNGAEALRLCRLHTYAAIVLDLHLPLLDGISFLRLRESVDAGRAPVLAISGTTDDALIRRALDLGAAAFLQKPLEPARLADELRRILPV